MAYRYFKDLPRSTPSDKALHAKAFNIVKDLKYDGYQRWFPLVVHEFYDKKSLCEIKTNQLLAEKLHKPTIKNL